MPIFVFEQADTSSATNAAIKRPREIAYFSFDDNHVCHPLSDQSLRYYYPPFFEQSGQAVNREQTDLSQGFDSFRRFDSTQDLHLDALLETLICQERKQNERIDADFVTWRGMMTKILTAAYDDYAEFEMNAKCFEGTIFIEEHYKPKEPAREKRHGPSQAQMEYWGYKFETLSTLPRSWSECSRDLIENRSKLDVDTYAQYCSIVRTGIGGHTIVLAGEVDAVRGGRPDDENASIPYVELKTSMEFAGHPADELRYEKKMCRFWAQSFLLGVPTIIVGLRSKNGHLLRLLEHKTMDIPRIVLNQGARSWDGNRCIKLTAAFLGFVKEHVREGTVWRIEKRKGVPEIELRQIDGHEDIVSAAYREHRSTWTPSVADET